ncbi:OmpA family protein [Bacteroidales bacterium OttesenSCG-928-C19]|nr:OmpA family protein [Bacteroidales bacterium OttesenSCG-928-C19]
MRVFITILIAVCSIVNVQAQSSRSKKQEQVIIPGKQKVHKTDYDSIWKFTNFNTKGKYFIDFDFNSFLNMPKKVKSWGAMEPLISYMQSNSRQAVNLCVIYAVNPTIESPSRKLQLINETGNSAKNALNNLTTYLQENDFGNKISIQVAEIDYIYWLGEDYYTLPVVKDEVIPVGILVSLGTKKNVLFPAASTEAREFKNIKFFPNNSDLIESYISVIKEVANFLKTDDRLEVVLTGYTDNTGTETYNINLSKKRADVIKNELLKLNIPPHRIEVVAMGSSNPIGDNNTHEGKVANNRVEISIR